VVEDQVVIYLKKDGWHPTILLRVQCFGADLTMIEQELELIKVKQVFDYVTFVG
jgi:hypothetical protein